MNRPKTGSAKKVMAMVLSLLITASMTPVPISAETLEMTQASLDDGSIINQNTVKTQAEQQIRPCTVSLDVSGVENNESAVKMFINGVESQTGTTVQSGAYQKIELVAQGEYRIVSVKINGEVNTEEAKKYFVLDNYQVNEDMKIEIVLSKTYTIDFQYNAELGTLQYQTEQTGETPVNAPGEVKLKFNDNEQNVRFDVILKEPEKYRVASITVDDNMTEFQQNGQTVTDYAISANQNHTVSIVFAMNQYTVSAMETQNGSVSIENENVDYNGSTGVTVKPDSGYYISALSLVTQTGEVAIAEGTVDENGFFTINNITSDTQVKAEFALVPAATLDQIRWNYDDAISNKDNVFYFASGTKAVFSTDKEGMILEDDQGNKYGGRNVQSVEISAETKIVSAKLYYNDGGIQLLAREHLIDLGDGIDIRYYAGPEAVLTCESLPVGCDCYADDVTVAVSVDIPDGFPKVAKAEYWITGKEEEVVELTSLPKSITVSAAENNAENVQLNLRVTDEKGMTAQTDVSFSICTDAPVVEKIEISGETAEGAKADCFQQERVASVVITDKEYAAARNTECFTITRNGETLSADEKTHMITWSTNANVHTATIRFTEDGEYTWSVNYCNKAGKKPTSYPPAEGNAVYKFIIDTTPPTDCTLVSDESVWDKLLPNLTFGIWKPSPISVKAVVSDDVSGIQEIAYYKYLFTTDLKNYKETALTVAELETLYAEGAFDATSKSVKIAADEKAVVYARILDNAGHVVYLGTDGLIVDDTKPDVSLSITDGMIGTGINNKVYGGAVTFSASVNDLNAGDAAFSGIKQVYYTVSQNNKNIDKQTLYEWSESEKTLCDSWEKTFIIDPRQNAGFNQNGLKVMLHAVDQAGNTYTDSVNLSINATAPSVSIEFENTESPTQIPEPGYYHGRTATITIEDREDSFSAEAATAAIQITASNVTDLSGTPVEDVVPYTISEWKSDGSKHTATVTFDSKYNANYTWADFVYTNSAGNTSDAVMVEDFTIDNTAPKGVIQIEENAWEKLLETLTFGLYSNTSMDVTASASDETSPIKIAYFLSVRQLSEDELLMDNKTSWIPVETPEEMPMLLETLNGDQRFIAYLRVMDYAGNYTFVCSDGYVIDTQDPSVILTPSQPATKMNGSADIYNDDVSVKVEVNDGTEGSGIKSVTYEILKDGILMEEGSLYQNDISKLTRDERIEIAEELRYKNLKRKLTFEGEQGIIIPAAQYNSCDVEVIVTVTDQAGNTNSRDIPLKLDIDTIAPEIELEYDNNNDNEGNGYFDAVRTATLTITERDHHFNPENVKIDITAVDAAGQAVPDAYTMSSWTLVENDDPDAQQHVMTIEYKKDANYTFAVSCTDAATNKNEGVDTGTSVAPFTFTIDTTAPEGAVKAESAEGRTEEWSELSSDLHFGFWSKERISVTGTATDDTSPVEGIYYYRKDGAEILTEEELAAVNEWAPLDTLSVTPNAQFAVYLKIVDLAGNERYINTDGLIVDDNAPVEELTAPEITLTPQQSASGIYNDDVTIDVTVRDPQVGGTYSGLRKVSYRVLNMGQVTQSGDLEIFDVEYPSQDELKPLYTGQIRVDSSLNNSNDVVIEVYAEDNALNGSSESVAIKIDTTPPAIIVSYDNNDANGTFFNASRTATVTVIERNFDANEVRAVITNTDQTIPSLSAWSQSGGTGNGDDTRWTATIAYNHDGDYTFAVGCTDMAGNACSESEVQYAGGTVAPTEFTIDLTKPVISVSYDNTDAANDNYYSADRTATITVEEHNFNPGAIQIALNSVKDGAAAAAPEVSGWTTVGNVHTATVNFSEDAKYTLAVNGSDAAGNAADAFAPDTFYIDKTAPTLTIDNIELVNGDEAAPIVSYDDANFDHDSVTISLTAVNRGTVDPEGEAEDTENGGKFSFHDFDRTQEMDDIYTLTASVKDLAGNTVLEEMTFSVNRFGSTYALHESAKQLNGTFVQTPIDIMIDEFNVDPLSEIKITLFKNNETIVLDEGTDYSIDLAGGNGQWHKYTYTVFQENFEDDGVYRITLHSKDAADNVAENTLDTKNMEIGFGVDKTPPSVVVANLEAEKTYAEEMKNVVLTADDNLKLASVSVYLDGVECRSWNTKEVEQVLTSNEPFNFDIAGDSKKVHNVKIVCVDEAGNPMEMEITDFYVTTDLLVRFFNNKILFFGVLGGIGVLIALLILFIVMKRRKRDQL